MPKKKPHFVEPNQKYFYASQQGWKMFDFRYLTPALLDFLNQEAFALAQITKKHKNSHLIEVGCGYGRYLAWASSRGIKYDGIDLVPWLIEMGKVLAQKRRAKDKIHQELHNLSVEEIEKVFKTFDAKHLYKIRQRSLVFFPFNCFGNLENTKKTLKALLAVDTDIFISTFKNDDATTELRKKYYENCGYTNVRAIKNNLGTLMISSEGLHAYAYSKDYLTDLFSRCGFKTLTMKHFGKIGLAVFIQRSGSSKRLAKPKNN